MNLRLLSILVLVTGSLGAQVTVEFKVFPQPYSLMVQGEVRSPFRVEGTKAWFSLPPGETYLTLTASGHQPLRIRRNLQQGSVVQERLDPRSSPLSRLGTFSTGKKPRGLAFSPDGTKLFVPLQDDAGIEVLDLTSGKTLKRLVPPGAQGTGYIHAQALPGKNQLWVTQSGASKVHVFSLSSLEYLTSWATGGSPEKILFTREGDKAFITDTAANTLKALDTTTGALLKSIPLGGIPRDLALEGDWVYVALYDAPVLEKINKDTFVSAGKLSYGPQGAMRGVASGSGRLYMADMLRSVVLEAQGDTGRYLRYLALGPNPTDMAASGSWVLALTRGTNNPQDYTLPGPDFGKLVVLDKESFTVTAQHWGGNQPTGLTVSADGRRVAFANSLDNTVEVFRLEP